MTNPVISRKLALLQSELSDRLERVEMDRGRRNGGLPADFSDQAVQRANDEVLDRLAESTRAELAQIQHALSRLEHDEFGVCEVCGGTIEADRLHAVPYATACRRCVQVAPSA